MEQIEIFIGARVDQSTDWIGGQTDPIGLTRVLWSRILGDVLYFDS
jgi:hypothetical protein